MYYARIKDGSVASICFFTDDKLFKHFLAGHDDLIPLPENSAIKCGDIWDSSNKTFHKPQSVTTPAPKPKKKGTKNASL